MTGPLDVVIALLCLAFVLALIGLAIKTDRIEKSRRRRLRALWLEEVGILAPSWHVPTDANRRNTYLQKLEGLRSKGPRGWVKP